MAVKIIEVTYFSWGTDWDCTFKIDDEIFTPQIAKACLNFFDWDFNSNEDPIIEYCKKLAKKVMGLSISLSLLGIKNEFFNLEGYPSLDGKFGVELIEVDQFEINEEDFSFEITSK